MSLIDKPLILGALVTTGFVVSACASDGAIIGGAAGGTTGAVVGDATGIGTVEGALIGGTAGAIIGDEVDDDDDPDRG